MRLAVTIVRLHGEKEFKVACGPDVPIDEQVKAIKELARAGKVHPEVAQVQLWNSSTGLTKRFKFRAPGEPASADDAPESGTEAPAAAAPTDAAPAEASAADEPVSKAPAAKKSKPKK